MSKLDKLFKECVAAAESLGRDGAERYVLSMHLVYRCYGREVYSLVPDPHPHVRDDGVEFYMVGHNASHQFYLGAKDGQVYKGSIGEDICDCDFDDDCDVCYGSGVKPGPWVQRRVTGDADVGYIGHV